MLYSKFGIEIEFTGITRQEAAVVVSKYFDCGYDRPMITTIPIP